MHEKVEQRSSDKPKSCASKCFKSGKQNKTAVKGQTVSSKRSMENIAHAEKNHEKITEWGNQYSWS